MATMNLNIYSKGDKTEIEKVYTAESYELMLGTVEDIMSVVDIDKLTNDVEILKVIVKCYKYLMPFLKDIFPGVTDDELKRVKVKELIPVFGDVIKSIIDDLNLIKSGN